MNFDLLRITLSRAARAQTAFSLRCNWAAIASEVAPAVAIVRSSLSSSWVHGRGDVPAITILLPLPSALPGLAQGWPRIRPAAVPAVGRRNYPPQTIRGLRPAEAHRYCSL
jgi:hypothetical protein